MKPWLLVVLIPALAIAAYFVLNPGAPATGLPAKAAVSAENPFFYPKAVAIPFGTDKMDFADQSFKAERYDDAVSALGAVYAERPAPADKAGAMQMAGQILFQKNDPSSRRYAREVLQAVINQYQGQVRLDSAHFYLGMIHVQEANAPVALFHFTTLLKDYPQSPFALNSAYVAQQIASVLATQDESVKGTILNRLKPLLPRNTKALIAILTSLCTTLIWFASAWQNHWTKLFQRKDPLLWLVLVAMMTLAGLNYVMEDQSHAKSMLEATKALPTVVKR